MLARHRSPAHVQDAVLLAPVGVYTAPLCEMIWALYRHRGLCVREAFVQVEKRGLKYVREELFDGGILGQLAQALNDTIVDEEHLHLCTPRHPDGGLIECDDGPDEAQAIRETLWCAAKDAVARAQDRPVVFALLPGARRTTTALLTAFFQLLARPEDLLLDVRVRDPRVGLDVPFYFPEQPQRYLRRGHSKIDATRVGVELIELELPRLSGVLEGSPLTSYESALQVSKKRSASALPVLSIDLEQGDISVDGQAVGLSIAERLWYAYLALRRGDSTDGWVVAGQSGHEDFQRFLERAGAKRWARSIRTKPLRALINGEFVHDEDLRNMRGKTVQRLKRWCKEYRPELSHYLVPQADGRGHQRLALPAHRVRIRGLASLPKSRGQRCRS